MNLDVDDIFGQYTCADAMRLEDTFHGSPQQNRNVARFVSEVLQRPQEHFNDRLKAADTELHERFEILDDQTIAVKEEAQKVTKGIKSGRLTAAEARKDLARIGTTQRELRERAEQLRHDDAALKEMAAMDVGDYEADMLQRYPALRRQLPTLTPGYLNQP